MAIVDRSDLDSSNQLKILVSSGLDSFKEWVVIDDAVMGGLSKGMVDVTLDGCPEISVERLFKFRWHYHL